MVALVQRSTTKEAQSTEYLRTYDLPGKEPQLLTTLMKRSTIQAIHFLANCIGLLCAILGCDRGNKGVQRVGDSSPAQRHDSPDLELQLILKERNLDVLKPLLAGYEREKVTGPYKQALLRVLREAGWDIRFFAAGSVSLRQDPDVARSLRELAEDKSGSSESAIRARNKAAESLGKMGGPALGEIRNLLDSVDLTTKRMGSFALRSYFFWRTDYEVQAVQMKGQALSDRDSVVRYFAREAVRIASER